ncbi:MAG: PD-(D/E)XK nuclease family protein [Chloroflexi bacterium]|nr:PD-(D/E)XK nuclease family protein [Chloroflexota bacterium]
MPVLREHGPYIHPSWLPRLLIGMDHCEHKIWFQAHHDGRTWTRVASDFNSVTYNLQHTDLMKRCAQEYEERGYSVTLESQNEFRISLAGATVSGRMDLVATRDQDLVIIDAKAAKPSEAHAVQVMLYMLFIQFQGSRTQGMTVTGEVYYGEDHTMPIAAVAAGEEFREMVEGLISRLTARTPPRKVPSASECRFCPIPSEYCPERVEV